LPKRSNAIVISVVGHHTLLIVGFLLLGEPVFLLLFVYLLEQLGFVLSFGLLTLKNVWL